MCIIFIPIVQMEKLRHRVVKELNIAQVSDGVRFESRRFVSRVSWVTPSWTPLWRGVRETYHEKHQGEPSSPRRPR